MDNNTAKLLEKLAQKLGTTSDYLWHVLIRQARVDSITNIFMYIGVLIITIVLLKLHAYFSNDDNEWSYDAMEELVGAPMVIASIITTVMIIICLCTIPSTITGFINPEYWALEKVMDVLK